MSRRFEDLPIEVQTDITSKRTTVHGWEPWTQPTPVQWMTFYQVLNAPAREYIVEQLLELAQLGSNCQQAAHDEMYDNFMMQLRGVTQLHNARVDEVAMLRARLDRLEGRTDGPLAPTPEEIEAARPSRVLEADDIELLSVEFTEHPLPGMELRVALPTEAGHDGQ